jgi:hypothetical protein
MGRQGELIAHPGFGRSIKPIPTITGRLCPPPFHISTPLSFHAVIVLILFFSVLFTLLLAMLWKN